MKKIFIYVMLIFTVLAVPVKAEFKNPPITDNAGYLSETELLEISAALDEVRNKYNMEAAIYTEDVMSGTSAMASADDIYDYGGYGAGEDMSGIMLYISRSTREYHFTTCGKGIDAFTDNGLIYLENKVVPYLGDNDYYGAFKEYAAEADKLLGMWAEGKPYDKKQLETNDILMILGVCLLAPLAIAYIMMQKKLKKMKTATENNYALNYVNDQNLSVSRDMFLFSNIVKTKREKSSGSGSSTHTSSSGTSHGGRGGSF